jgi:hypothetical protein
LHNGKKKKKLRTPEKKPLASQALARGGAPTPKLLKSQHKISLARLQFLCNINLHTTEAAMRKRATNLFDFVLLVFFVVLSTGLAVHHYITFN